MIICDRAYLRELESRMKAARRLLPREVAAGIDAEIEAIEAQVDPKYSARTITIAFRLIGDSNSAPLSNRIYIHKAKNGFQGHLRRSASGQYGTWFDAVAICKSLRAYQSWADPNDAIGALRITHRLHRYLMWPRYHHGGKDVQKRLDKWRLEHGDPNA